MPGPSPCHAKLLTAATVSALGAPSSRGSAAAVGIRSALVCSAVGRAVGLAFPRRGLKAGRRAILLTCAVGLNARRSVQQRQLRQRSPCLSYCEDDDEDDSASVERGRPMGRLRGWQCPRHTRACCPRPRRSNGFCPGGTSGRTAVDLLPPTPIQLSVDGRLLHNHK
jgi:hypothetical protein